MMTFLARQPVSLRWAMAVLLSLLPLDVLGQDQTVLGQDQTGSSDGTKQENTSRGLVSGRVVLKGLNAPRGIAIQPGTGHVFIAESGAGQILRLSDEGKREVVATGFSTTPIDQDSTRLIGPLGLSFLNNETLVVGGGGAADGQNHVYAVRVPDPGKPPTRVDQALKFRPTGDPGRFVAVADSTAAIYSVINRGGQGRLAVLPIRKADLLNHYDGYDVLRPFPVGPNEDATNPMGLTLGIRGELVVAYAGNSTEDEDSTLSFYRVNDGKQLLSLPTGLMDMVAVEYGASQPPTHPLLYALDHAESTPDRGGLFRLDAWLDAGIQRIRATRIARCQRPTAMAFGIDGSLYVAELGSPTGNTETGQIVKFPAGL